MSCIRPFLVLLLLLALVIHVVPCANACGTETLQPIFVVEDSPDPPFKDFTQGKIGIVKPSFGRKTLVIAYRYLTGGSFSQTEQEALVEALKGASPEPRDDSAIKAWVAARDVVMKDDGKLPEIYRQKEYGGFDFFPNCTRNAFEVAAETLKDRTERYGADDRSVLEWVLGQDIVFQNCAVGGSQPPPVGSESPLWLRKDRDYQIAAAFFYSLQFDEARQRFEKIAQDPESDWQQTADYLVGRTFVRQASLESDEDKKRSIYERADLYLNSLLARAGKFRVATQKLLGLIKYRLRPEERVRELAQVMEQSGNENLRQDLIDYTWLLDKFDQQIQDAEEKRLASLKPAPNTDEEQAQSDAARAERDRLFQAVQRGELIQLWFYPYKSDGQVDPGNLLTFHFKPEASAAEILETVETTVGRKLTTPEQTEIYDRQKQALEWVKWKLNPVRKFDTQFDYDGCQYNCNHLTLDLLPQFLTADTLNDWIFTFQSEDPRAYSHALAKWRDTQSEAWLVAALTKATKASPSLKRLLARAETVHSDAPMFATVAYNRIRLLTELGRQAEARSLLEDLIATKLDMFPVSAQNQFIEQRMDLAQNLAEFLKFAARKPVVFYEYGTTGSIADIIGNEYSEEPPTNERKKFIDELTKWDGRVVFDERAVDILNWNFPLAKLIAAAHEPSLPDYLQERILFTAWTRAILLKNDVVAQQAATEIIHRGLDSFKVFDQYLKAPTPAEKEHAATYALLRLPFLSPYVPNGIPDLDTGEDGYYLELAWWCVLSETDYDNDGNEVVKKIPSLSFFSADLRADADKERAALRAVGDGKKFLGNQTLEWAKKNPDDPRIPEALFIAAMANQTYKYGCGSWEHDEKVQQEAEKLLREKYPNSSWTAKLSQSEQ